MIGIFHVLWRKVAVGGEEGTNRICNNLQLTFSRVGVTRLRAAASLISRDIGGPPAVWSNTSTTIIQQTDYQFSLSLSVNNFQSLNMVKAKLSNKILTALSCQICKAPLTKESALVRSLILETGDGDKKNSHR